MKKLLRVDPSDAAPIWRQIEEGLRRLVAFGALSPGHAVPSVRDLAKELQVNPATVAKAYQRLTDSGVLAVKRGEGTYVSDAPPPVEKGERVKTLREGAVRYASLALTLGASREDAVDEVNRAWPKAGHGGKGGAS
jgi:GntR family transcriptional regulator